MISLKNKTFQILLHVLLPIYVGGFIYILFRSKSLVMFDWFEAIGILDFIQTLRNYFIGIKGNVPIWVYYSLPDGLWTYSFTSTILLFESNWKVLKFWLLVPFLFGPLIEIFQLFRLFPGTFDPLDLLFYLYCIYNKHFNF